MTDQPRTAAGRALLDNHMNWGEWYQHNWCAAILAIEAQARPAVASEGLRAALETLVDLWYMDDASDEHMYAIGVAFVAAKAALASDAGSVGALDVERLARAIDECWADLLAPGGGKPDGLRRSAAAIAAAYAAAGEGEQE